MEEMGLYASLVVKYLLQALLEERKMYIFVVDHFCTVVHNEISLNALVSRTDTGHVV